MMGRQGGFARRRLVVRDDSRVDAGRFDREGVGLLSHTSRMWDESGLISFGLRIARIWDCDTTHSQRPRRKQEQSSVE